MADSAYYVAWLMAVDSDLTNRVAAAAQQEAETSGEPFDPEAWARGKRWVWATQSDWIASVQGAIATGITAWGSNPAVITDQHILSWVQSEMTLPA